MPSLIYITSPGTYSGDLKALVLKKIPFGESDLIVRFLLETGGVISGFAAGARNSKRRFSHQFDMAGLYELEWNSSVSEKKLQRIHRCDLINHQSALSINMEMLCRWAMILEWIASDEETEFSFEEVCRLREDLNPQNGRYHLFFLRQMKIHGLHPELENCMICASPVQNRILFNLSEGGVVHSSCSRGILMNEEAHTFLKIALKDNTELPLISKIAFENLDEIIIPFLEWQLGRSMKSQKVFVETTHSAAYV